MTPFVLQYLSAMRNRPVQRFQRGGQVPSMLRPPGWHPARQPFGQPGGHATGGGTLSWTSQPQIPTNLPFGQPPPWQPQPFSPPPYQGQLPPKTPEGQPSFTPIRSLSQFTSMYPNLTSQIPPNFQWPTPRAIPPGGGFGFHGQPQGLSSGGVVKKKKKKAY